MEASKRIPVQVSLSLARSLSLSLSRSLSLLLSRSLSLALSLSRFLSLPRSRARALSLSPVFFTKPCRPSELAVVLDPPPDFLYLQEIRDTRPNQSLGCTLSCNAHDSVI